MSGRVVRVVERAPVSGAGVRIGERSAIADSEGRFTLTDLPEAAGAAFIAGAPGYLTRQTAIRVEGTRHDLEIDIIPEGDPFLLDFFRQFARNALESRVGLMPLRPWTRAPRFYVKTTVGETGRAVPDDLIQALTSVIVNSVRELSGGRLEVGAVEFGTGARPAASGWVNVVFERELSSPTAAGMATVGGDQGTLWLRFDPDNPQRFVNHPSECPARVVQVAAHEIRHTMGYSHTSSTYEPLFRDPGCDGADLSHVLRYHAGVMYSRPPGNEDPDTDPRDFMFSVTERRNAGVVSCTDAQVDAPGTSSPPPARR